MESTHTRYLLNAPAFGGSIFSYNRANLIASLKQIIHQQLTMVFIVETVQVRRLVGSPGVLLLQTLQDIQA